jgi:hypothetical protein
LDVVSASVLGGQSETLCLQGCRFGIEDRGAKLGGDRWKASLDSAKS